MSLYPEYTRKQKEALAWLFVALVKVETDPLRLSIRHANADFLRRFLQLIQLGTLRRPRYDFNTRTWELADPQEIARLLRQIEPHIHTQADHNLALALIGHIEKSMATTRSKLERLAKKHNIYFYIDRY